MRVLSNAFMSQVEIIQKDRWDHGPLELVFLKYGSIPRAEEELHVIDWNRHYRGGFLRPGDAARFVFDKVPWVQNCENPNVFLVPSIHGYTELHKMLLSLVPEPILLRHGLKKTSANLWLIPYPPDRRCGAGIYAKAAAKAFEEYIWPKLARKRGARRDFSAKSPIHLLAGDTSFWMSRIYRIAIERADAYEPVQHEEEWWKPLDKIWEDIRKEQPPEVLKNVTLTRPLFGGTLWLESDQEECEEVVEEAFNGGGVMESLDPVLDVLHSHRTHEDFSSRYSWVKEDFERTFYSKRARVKVSMIETVDDLPAWSAGEAEGYGNLLFRDILAFFNEKERHIILALRQGKTVTEIGRDSGHKGHAAVSRRVARIKNEVRELLGMQKN